LKKDLDKGYSNRIPRFWGKNSLKRLYNNKVGLFTQASTKSKQQQDG